MGKLENHFLWSFSREKAFERCRREYYNQVFGSWGGWERQADDYARLCYRLSKMQTLDTWAGQIVHGAVAGAIQAIQAGEQDLDPLQERARTEATNRLREGWRQSKSGAWRQSPKWNLNLFEHYYDQPVPTSRTDQIREKVHESIDGFFASDFLRDLAGGAYRIVTVEELLSFELYGNRVCLMMDFAGAIEDGAIEIWDWKTGKPREKDLYQARIYAVAAAHKWKIEPTLISQLVLYLREQVADTTTFSADDLQETEARILDSCARMKERLVDPRKNIARIEDYPKTNDLWKCRHCPYAEACYSTRDLTRLEAA